MGARPRWPSGSLGILAGVLAGTFVMGVTTSFLPATRSVVPLKQLWEFSILVFRKEVVVQAVMGTAALAHIAEAAFITLPKCRKHKLTASGTGGWIGLTLLMGFASLLELDRALKRAQ